MELSSTATLDIYRMCFALNNIAIWYMERGNFREAVKAMKEVASALKLVDQDHLIESVKSNLRKRLQKASSRIATSCPKSGNRMFEVASLEAGDLESMKAAQQYGPTTSFLSPIRLCDFPAEDTFVNDDGDFQITILFYNYHVAQLGLRLSSTKEKSCYEHILREAFRLLNLLVEQESSKKGEPLLYARGSNALIASAA